jgi:hypothetical protein
MSDLTKEQKNIVSFRQDNKQKVSELLNDEQLNMKLNATDTFQLLRKTFSGFCEHGLPIHRHCCETCEDLDRVLMPHLFADGIRIKTDRR